jgi:gliding motility-associated-like protein
VDVIPGKIYKIGFWGSIYSGGFLTRPAIFLNGIKAGELEYALQDYFEWTNFSGYWNSGSATKVDVCIRIISNANADNVFAIDDILFAESEMFMDSVKMNVAKPGALTVSDDSSICKGNSVQLFASGANNYTWSPAAGLSNPNTPNPVASPQQTTKYYVTSTPSGANCAAKDSILVTIAPSPELIISPDANICSGGSIQLFVSGATTYKWTPIDGLSDPNSPSPVASPSVTTLYHVEGANAGGCKDTSSVKVIVSAEAKLYVPTAFTPNNDGVNDCFRIPNASGSSNFELSIFNRFGEKVFYSSDPGKCWDGTYKAKREPAGVFVYYLKMTNGCGNIIKKGTVSIIY